MRRAWILPALCGVLAGSFLAGYRLSSHGSAPAAQVTVVDAVRTELAARYYRPVPRRVLALRSVPAMLAALHDPYTQYLDPAAFSVVERRLAARYAGIGVELLPTSRGLLVAAVRPGPAEAAGVRTGDLIVAIDGIAAASLDPDRAAQLIGGQPGSRLGLTLQRGAAHRTLVLRRAEVDSPNVQARLVSVAGRRLGVVAVQWFASGTSARVAAALRRFRAERVRAIVLDVRGDPGGLLREGIRTAGLFLQGGRIVTVVGQHGLRRTYEADGADLAGRLPLAVLVDKETASAAEVLAAALREDNRAAVVGSRTFGKAVVQAIQPLADGGALAFTVARYYTPAGTDISGRGVAPSVRATDDPATARDEALLVAERLLLRR